jgi:hypothetical protein
MFVCAHVLARACKTKKVRAGESEAEALGYVLSNPVAKTSMDSGLSARGKRQVCPSFYIFLCLSTLSICLNICVPSGPMSTSLSINLFIGPYVCPLNGGCLCALVASAPPPDWPSHATEP